MPEQQQTLWLPLSKLSPCIGKNLEDEAEIQPTNFDNMITDFLDSLVADNFVPLTKNIVVAGEKILCFVSYISDVEFKRAQNYQKLALKQ